VPAKTTLPPAGARTGVSAGTRFFAAWLGDGEGVFVADA
jgi:hypothetical protein